MLVVVAKEFEKRVSVTFYKMADETEQNIGENDENTTFKDLVSVKLKFLFITIWQMCNKLVVTDVFCVFFNRESLRFCVKRVKKSVGRNQRKFNVNVYL